MVKDTLTLALNGDISLQDFSEAIRDFYEIVNGLKNDVAKEASIEWLITDLEAGSAIATIRGIAHEESHMESIEKVINAYLDLGESIQKERPVNYSQPVKSAAKRLFSLINGRIKSVRFETEDKDVEIFAAPSKITIGMPLITLSEGNFGSVRGRIQSMTNRGQLRFTLYDLIDDRAISCYLAPGSEDIMRESWGKLAMVEGLIRRDPETGRATTVRGVKDIRLIPEYKEGEWREAIGVALNFLESDLPEDVIRRARDG